MAGRQAGRLAKAERQKQSPERGYKSSGRQGQVRNQGMKEHPPSVNKAEDERPGQKAVQTQGRMACHMHV